MLLASLIYIPSWIIYQSLAQWWTSVVASLSMCRLLVEAIPHFNIFDFLSVQNPFYDELEECEKVCGIEVDAIIITHHVFVVYLLLCWIVQLA